MLTAATCLSVAAAHGTQVNNSTSLAVEHKWNTFYNPFEPNSVEHILESDFDLDKPNLNHEAFVRKMQSQCFDSMEDALDTDQSHVPAQVIAHKVSTTPRRKVVDGDIQVTTERHVRVQTVWKTGEISWAQLNALKEQNPFALFNCVETNKSHDHPDFK